MYNIKINNFEKIYLLDELIKVFLRPEEYTILSEEDDIPEDVIVFNDENFPDKNLIKQQIFNKLSVLTGKKPEWGILTGIRPVKLAGELCVELGSPEKAIQHLMDYYYLDRQKAQLSASMYLHQIESVGIGAADTAGIYIGIPFCPTRCVYCSFASNQVEPPEIAKYLVALHEEISYVGKRMRDTGIFPESIYIGGGTPTTLTAQQLNQLLDKIEKSFDMSRLKEFTVEAGRPDTITSDKLEVLSQHNIKRISINPQSMKDRTLELIGRSHKSEDINTAFKQAQSFGIEDINADVIAGLPEESLEDFKDTLKKVIDLGPNNITVHSLAVKRASKLIDIDKDYHYKKAKIVSDMLDLSHEMLTEAGFIPYYLYRQKHMAGAFENTGYCLPGRECVYNIRIMDEHQTIIALGAGGITKVYYPDENRLERVPNVTNYEQYISRIDEMLDRKEVNLFRR
ncbi:MAG: coproporphyrinogen dehydrogenase HemZ [Anaerovoracaceae bacterium]